MVFGMLFATHDWRHDSRRRHWVNVVNLLDIVDYVFARDPVTTSEMNLLDIAYYVFARDPVTTSEMNLLDIAYYVFASVTTSEKSAHVAVLVEDFLTEFSHLYERPPIPKMHCLVHLPSWMSW